MDRHVRLLGAPVDYGANRRGVDMGPSAIRYADLEGRLTDIGIECTDGGDIPAPRVEEDDVRPDGNAKYMDQIRDVTLDLTERVASTLDGGGFPLVLGGDHSIAMGSLAGSSRDADVGVIWFDAHADYNTPETSPSGNVHGMPLAAAHGYGSFSERVWANASGVREENTVLVGIRDVDDGEQAAIEESGVTAFTMTDIDERGITAVVEDAVDIASDAEDGVHVSIDLDWLDPRDAPGVGTPVRGGVTYREAHTALETVTRRDRADGILRSMDIVEVNPILDEHNATAEMAAELAASALGNRII